MESNKNFLNNKDVDFETMKSSGPGGQSVNKTASAVRLRASIEDLSLSEKVKNIIKENLPSRLITKDNEIIVENAEGRSQKQNKKNALRIANKEIRKAIEKAKDKKAKEKHKKRARKKQKKGGSSGPKNKKEAQQKQYRKETTEDLLEQAIDEDPDLKDRLSND